ncbi:hypothetical protein [Halobacillus halophilus]|nr:hypothetical protein [Halobacillus halophilus]
MLTKVIKLSLLQQVKQVLGVWSKVILSFFNRKNGRNVSRSLIVDSS